MKVEFKYLFLIALLILTPKNALGNTIIKIGLLAPLSGEFKNIGKSIIESARIALNKIDNNKIYILPRDTKGENSVTLKQAEELYAEGIRIFIGPVFNKNLKGLEKFEGATFFSLTNKVINNPKNVISAGINATSQLNAIKKFIESNKIKKTIFLTPKVD